MLGYDEKSIERLKQENGRMAGQLSEAISIIENGTDYEKMHLLDVLKDGVPQCHLCNDTGYNRVSGDHAAHGDFCSCRIGAERHQRYDASWEPWDVNLRSSSDMGMPSWVCAPIRIHQELDEDSIEELPVEQYFDKREAQLRALTWQRELRWEAEQVTSLYLTQDELTGVIKSLEAIGSHPDKLSDWLEGLNATKVMKWMELLHHQLQNSEQED